MHRNTTPTLTLKLHGLDLDKVEKISVALKQDERLIVKDGVIKEDGTVEITLTRDETLSFHTGQVKVQARWRFADGKMDASCISCLEMHPVLDEGGFDD